MRKIGIVMLGIFCLAATPDEDAQRLVDEGMKLFEAGKLTQAREVFERVQKLAPDRANPYRLLGLVDFRMGRCKEAIAEFDIFLSRVTAGDRRVTEAVSMRDKCKEELAPKLGRVVIDTSPAGADVRLDDENGAPLGVTPWKSDEVHAGSHVIYVCKAGYRASSRGFTLQKGETVKITLALEREAAAGPVHVPAYKKGWVWGVALGTIAAAGLAVGLGVGLTVGNTPVFEPTLPPYQLGLSR
jgi:hypothetical protein